MNYILYNNLANNGAGETWADKLLETLGGKVGEGYEKTTLVGLNLPEFLAKVTAEDTIYLVGGDGTINRFANDADGIEIPCPVLFISGKRYRGKLSFGRIYGHP